MSGVAANVPIRKRSQRLSDFSDIAHHADSQDGISLSSRQQALLKSAWTEMTSKKDGSNAGEWILKRIFDKHPEIKALFGMENVAKKKLTEQPQFKLHSDKFNDTLQMVVEGVDALDNSLGPLLFSYGSKHATLATAKGFRPEHWDVFSEAMVDYVAHWKGRLSQRVETIQAWRLLALFVVSKVRLGFDTELRAVEALVDRGVSLFPPPPLPLRKRSANACCLFQPTTTTQLRPPNPAD